MNLIHLHCIVIVLFVAKFIKCESQLKELVDLTWYFENNTVYWVGVQPFQFTKMLALVTDSNFWLAMNEFCAGEHGGTHIDAPYHFNKYGIKVGEIPLSKLIVQGAVIDVSDKVRKLGASYTLQIQDIEEWTSRVPSLDKSTVILIKFGWSQFYYSREKYLGLNEKNNSLNFPGLSLEAAEWFANNRNIVGVGMDVASADPGSSTTFPAHVTLNGAGKYIIENVKLIEHLPDYGFTLLVMPMNIAEGTGAPLRLLAVPHNYPGFC